MEAVYLSGRKFISLYNVYLTWHLSSCDLAFVELDFPFLLMHQVIQNPAFDRLPSLIMMMMGGTALGDCPTVWCDRHPESAVVPQDIATPYCLKLYISTPLPAPKD